MKYLLMAITVLVSLEGKTQTQNVSQSSNHNLKWLKGKLQGETYYINPLANNNFFLQEDWTVGTITLTDGTIFNDVKLRYLSYEDELVVYNENLKTLFVAEKKTIKEFTWESLKNDFIGIRKFINLDSLKMQDGKSYFEELFSGNAKLLAYHFISKVKVNPFTDDLGVLRDIDYRPGVNYFLLTDQNEFLKIKPKKTSFYKVIPEHKKEIRRLFRKNRLSITNQNSLIQAFSLLDEAGFL